MNPKEYWTKKHKARAKRQREKHKTQDENIDPDKTEEYDIVSDISSESETSSESCETCEDKCKCNDPHPLDPLARQLALLIVAALAFLIAAYWKAFLDQVQGDYFKTRSGSFFIFVLGLTIIATIIIYYLGSYIEREEEDD